MRKVSAAEVARQIRREGSRHGLVPLIVDGVCHVAQIEILQVDAGPLGFVSRRITSVCNVDMAHPLSNVWKSRIQRTQWNLRKVYAEAQARRDLAAVAELEPVRRERRARRSWMLNQVGRDEMAAGMRDVLGARRMRG